LGAMAQLAKKTNINPMVARDVAMKSIRVPCDVGSLNRSMVGI
jgi:hypothetical protein